MTPSEIERAIDQARTERSRHLLTVCAQCMAHLAYRIACLTGLLRGAAPERPTALS
jgi:hypothetical protein